MTKQHLFDLGWLFFLLILFGYFWSIRHNYKKIQNWNSCPGKIISFEWITRGHRLWPQVEYAYQIGEIEYFGDQMFLKPAHNNPNSLQARKFAFEIVEAYKNNESITVYYNPKNPRVSVLNNHVPVKLNMTLIFIGVLIGIHVTIAIIRF